MTSLGIPFSTDRQVYGHSEGSLSICFTILKEIILETKRGWESLPSSLIMSLNCPLITDNGSFSANQSSIIKFRCVMHHRMWYACHTVNMICVEKNTEPRLVYHASKQNAKKLKQKRSAVAETAAQCYISRIFAFEWGNLYLTHSFSVYWEYHQYRSKCCALARPKITWINHYHILCTSTVLSAFDYPIQCHK